MLVPVTGSMYVRGETTPLETLLVDVGTGYLIEKSFEEAKVSVCSLSSSRLSHACLRGETHTAPVVHHTRAYLHARHAASQAFLDRKMALIDSQAVNVQKTAQIKQSNLQAAQTHRTS